MIRFQCETCKHCGGNPLREIFSDGYLVDCKVVNRTMWIAPCWQMPCSEFVPMPVQVELVKIEP